MQEEHLVARIEALEMVVIELLAAKIRPKRIDRLLRNTQRCLALREKTVAFPPGFEWSDGAWRWRLRLLRMARETARERRL